VAHSFMPLRGGREFKLQRQLGETSQLAKSKKRSAGRKDGKMAPPRLKVAKTVLRGGGWGEGGNGHVGSVEIDQKLALQGGGAIRKWDLVLLIRKVH